ncbi:hypothetical protein [Paenibacillus xylanilyticus]|uniref:hypothetical protein n=1 Tax=Paenibacillus xylanilyticus TaxID=248903 RepID=UPI0039A2DF39
MKWKPIKFLALGIIVTSALSACSAAPEESAEPQTAEAETIQEQQDKPTESNTDTKTEDTESSKEASEPVEGQPPTVTEASTTIIKALQAEDMETIASWASQEGVRFSPFANIDPENDLVFKPDEISGLLKDTTKYVWRSTPGNEDSIEMTYADYHQNYVYNKDFIHDGENAVNAMIGEDAHLGNLHEVYPEANHDFVEFHVNGTEPDGRDWHTLRLVFEKIGQDHSLVGIVHDQWTP